jgi:hypothetical protein
VARVVRCAAHHPRSFGFHLRQKGSSCAFSSESFLRWESPVTRPRPNCRRGRARSASSRSMASIIRRRSSPSVPRAAAPTSPASRARRTTPSTRNHLLDRLALQGEERRLAVLPRDRSTARDRGRICPGLAMPRRERHDNARATALEPSAESPVRYRADQRHRELRRGVRGQASSLRDERRLTR